MMTELAESVRGKVDGYFIDPKLGNGCVTAAVCSGIEICKRWIKYRQNQIQN